MVPVHLSVMSKLLCWRCRKTKRQNSNSQKPSTDVREENMAKKVDVIRMAKETGLDLGRICKVLGAPFPVKSLATPQVALVAYSNTDVGEEMKEAVLSRLKECVVTLAEARSAFLAYKGEDRRVQAALLSRWVELCATAVEVKEVSRTAHKSGCGHCLPEFYYGKWTRLLTEQVEKIVTVNDAREAYAAHFEDCGDLDKALMLKWIEVCATPAEIMEAYPLIVFGEGDQEMVQKVAIQKLATFF